MPEILLVGPQGDREIPMPSLLQQKFSFLWIEITFWNYVPLAMNHKSQNSSDLAMRGPTCLFLYSLLGFFSSPQSSREDPISSAVYLTLSNVSSGNEFHRLSDNFEENKKNFNKALVLLILSVAVYIHKELRKFCSPSSLLHHHVSLVCQSGWDISSPIYGWKGRKTKRGGPRGPRVST